MARAKIQEKVRRLYNFFYYNAMKQDFIINPVGLIREIRAR